MMCDPHGRGPVRNDTCSDREESMEFVEYEIDSCIRGHHVYKDWWTSFVGEILNCAREIDNPHDPYAVVLCKMR